MHAVNGSPKSICTSTTCGTKPDRGGSKGDAASPCEGTARPREHQDHGHVLNATRIGLQESMRKYEEFRKTCTKLAQTEAGSGAEEERSDPATGSEVEVPPGVYEWRGRRDS